MQVPLRALAAHARNLPPDAGIETPKQVHIVRAAVAAAGSIVAGIFNQQRGCRPILRRPEVGLVDGGSGLEEAAVERNRPGAVHAADQLSVGFLAAARAGVREVDRRHGHEATMRLGFGASPVTGFSVPGTYRTFSAAGGWAFRSAGTLHRTTARPP